MSSVQKRKMKILLKKCFNILFREVLDLVEKDLLKKKRVWVRKWISNRNENGGSALLMRELKSEDPSEYRLALRLSPEMFDELLAKLSHKIQRADTFMRDAIPARLKLEVTLSFLATGNSYRSLSHFYRISKSTISMFIPEVCQEIYEALKENIKVPDEEEWRKIENGFRQKWNFPSCYGAIDGKHVTIKAPTNSGSVYYNYKKTNSVVLMAVVDDDYCFEYIDVGASGSASDGGVFRNSSIYNMLENNILPQGGTIVGDAAFPLKTYLMKPYPGQNLTTEQKIYNYRLSRARRIVENAFGILTSRFRIFERPIATNLDTVDDIVRATCSLHNWLRKNQSTYITRNCVDKEADGTHIIIPGAWRSETNNLISINNQQSNRSSLTAREKRDWYKSYFVNEGAVSWQNGMIH